MNKLQNIALLKEILTLCKIGLLIEDDETRIESYNNDIRAIEQLMEGV